MRAPSARPGARAPPAARRPRRRAAREPRPAPCGARARRRGSWRAHPPSRCSALAHQVEQQHEHREPEAEDRPVRRPPPAPARRRRAAAARRPMSPHDAYDERRARDLRRAARLDLARPEGARQDADGQQREASDEEAMLGAVERVDRRACGRSGEAACCLRRRSWTRYATAAAKASVKSAMPRRLRTTWNGRSALRRRGSASTRRRRTATRAGTRAPEARRRRRRRRCGSGCGPRRTTRHASIEATLSAKWMPCTGQTCRTSDQTR